MKLLWLTATVPLVCAWSQPYTISTISGIDRSQNGLAAQSVPYQSITGMAMDQSGALYFSDGKDRRVRRVDTQGIVTLIAGDGGIVLGPLDNVPAVSISMQNPGSLAVDRAGNVYVLDGPFNRIEKISTDGLISVIAGASGGSTADDIPATTADLTFCDAIAVDESGNIFIDDQERIRRIDTNGIITTVAGTGKFDNTTALSGPALTVNVGFSSQLVPDGLGNLYFADKTFGLVRKLTPDGQLTTVAGALNASTNPPSGPVSATSVGMYPVAIAVDGTFLYVDSEILVGNQIGANYLYRVTLSTGILELLGGGLATDSGDGGPVSLAKFADPYAALLAGDGRVYIGETVLGRIRLIENGTISNYVGRALPDGVPALGAPLLAPGALKNNSQNGIAFVESYQYVQQIDSAGILHTIPGPWQYPSSVASAAGNLFVSTKEGTIYKVPNGGSPVLIAGTGQYGHTGDNGPALKATFGLLGDLTVDSAGNVYVVDNSGSIPSVIRKITASSGIVTTIAGNSNTYQYLGDNSSPLSTGLSPCGLQIDDQQNLYIGDANNGLILRLSPAGRFTTIAGTGRSGPPGDGGPAINASLSGPCTVTFDSQSNLYFNDGPLRIRRIDTNGIITTIAGNGTGYPSTGDGGPAIDAQFIATGIAAGPFGVVYLADRFSDRIRKLEPLGAPDALVLAADAPTSGFVGQPLPKPITVRVNDSNGNGLAGIPVAFTVSPVGAASISPSTATTGADGTAFTNVTLGNTAGSVVVTATVLTVSPAQLTVQVQEQPSIFPGGVVGAALGPPPIQALSPNGLVSIFGRSLAPVGVSHQVDANDLIDGRLPVSLDGVCVLVNSDYAPLLYISPAQLNVQVPTSTSATTASVTIVRDCGTNYETVSSALQVPYQEAAPEFFYVARGTNGANTVAAFQSSDGSPVNADAPARPGDVVTLYGTGFGVASPLVQAGVLPLQPATLANPVTLTIGGVTLTPSELLYAGLSSFAGVDQMNVVIPNGIAPGDQPIFIAVGGTSSPNGAVISIAAP